MSEPRAAARRIARWLMPRVYESLVRTRAARAAARAAEMEWQGRTEDVLACPDNRLLDRVADAGRVCGNLQTMFNGIKVTLDGYYGKGMTQLLARNKGSHEPQEELVFADVLHRIPSGARMIECGAYWGFYSAWFARDVPGSKVWLIEPEPQHAEVGRQNFDANGLQGEFIQAMVGRSTIAASLPTICVDDFVADRGIDRLHILHADIQGAEVDMLRGAARTLSTQSVDFIFISTHGDSLHAECIGLLERHRYDVPVSVRPCESYSFDGLIVAHRKGLLDSPLPTPSRKPIDPNQRAAS